MMILRTTDGGKTWTVQASGTKRTLTGVFFVDSLTGWVVGDSGTILKTTNGGGISSIRADNEGILSSFSFLQNYPNPFNPSTTIRYGLPHKSAVQLTVFNTLGQEVALLENGEQEAGYHEVRFDGNGLSSGVYFYRMTAGTYAIARKFILIQ